MQRDKTNIHKGAFIQKAVSALLLCSMLFSHTSYVRAELSALGDVNTAIEALGYGITGQPSDTGDLIVGDTDVGGIFIDVAFDPGPLISSSGVVGNQDGSEGVISIDGFPSDWLIGDSGTTVDSAIDLIIGNEGSGTIDLFDSAKVQVGDNTFTEGTSPSSATTSEIVAGTGATVLGLSVTGYGEVNITSVATRFVTAGLVVGDEGVGEILVQSRGKLYSADTILGNQGDSIGTVTLSGVGTRWTVGDTTTSATLTIGNGDGSSTNAHGFLNVSTDALVQTTGVVTVNDTGHINLLGGRIRDIGGNAILNDGIIRGDGFIDAAMTLDTGGVLSNAVAEVQNGPTVTNYRENLHVSGEVINGGRIESLGGEMLFDSLVTNNSLIHARDAILDFSNTPPEDGTTDLLNTDLLALAGDITVIGDIDSSGGDIFTLDDTTLLLQGNLTFTSGIFGIAADGSGPPISVTGIADLAGATVDLELSSGFDPEVGIPFELLQANDGLVIPSNAMDAASGRIFDLFALGTSLFAVDSGLLTVPVGADFNGDGVVNALDLRIWENNFPIASGAPKSLGDADGDGDVDGADFMKLQRDFGIIPVPPITAVPEPSTMALALLTLVCCPRRRRGS